MSKKSKKRWRAIKFWMLSRMLVPLILFPIKAWMWTWRVSVESPAVLKELASPGRPRALAILHGSFLPMLGAFLKFGENRFSSVTMVSPSRDGQLLSDVIAQFGGSTVYGSTKARGSTGLLELIKETRAGKVGLLAIDGPRGPRAVPRSGILTLACQCRARLYVILPTGRPAIRFKSWDRAEFPLPFARVRVQIVLFHDYANGTPPDNELWALQDKILGMIEAAGGETNDITRLEKAPC